MKTKLGLGYRGTRSAAARGEKASGRVSLPANALKDLKRRLLEEQLAGVSEAGLRDQLQRAAAESTSVAWTTPFPLLALPELIAEKGREARRRYEHQRAIQNPARAAFSLSA